MEMKIKMENSDELKLFKTESSFKIIIIGGCDTGKTNLVQRYVHNRFSHAYRMTVSVLFLYIQCESK